MRKTSGGGDTRQQLPGSFRRISEPGFSASAQPQLGMGRGRAERQEVRKWSGVGWAGVGWAGVGGGGGGWDQDGYSTED